MGPQRRAVYNFFGSLHTAVTGPVPPKLQLCFIMTILQRGQLYKISPRPNGAGENKVKKGAD